MKEIKVCERCNEEFEVKDAPEDCSICPKCERDMDPEEEFNSYSKGGR